jgi:signal transduction histidine kinase
LVFLPSHNGRILVIPVVLAAWMSKPRGLIISLGCTILALFMLNSLSVGGIVWPPSLILTILSGSLALLVEGAVISTLRHALELARALELAQAAQSKSEQAEHQLDLAYEQQRQLNDLKDQFILNVSHEMRTPLTEVYGYLELLRSFQMLGSFARHLKINFPPRLFSKLLLYPLNCIHTKRPTQTDGKPARILVD